MSTRNIFVNGTWQPSTYRDLFLGVTTAGGENFDSYPISTWPDLDIALSAAAEAAPLLAAAAPERIADFLRRYAARIEARAAAITQAAQRETNLAAARLENVELPRTTDTLRQAAAAALEGSWALPTIDTKHELRSYLAPLGPVLIMGPNNFPLAYNAVAGGDFAAAVAGGNPVIAKAHPDHPTTTRLLAMEAAAAVGEAGLPKSSVQLLYHMSADTGLRAVADPRLAALAFTGSRRAGLALKAAAEQAGKPIYLEMSSLNPVIILPGALAEDGRREQIAEAFADSALDATGQYCTNPGLTLLLAGPATTAFAQAVAERFNARPCGTLLSDAVAAALRQSVNTLIEAGATTLAPFDATALVPTPATHPNTLLHASAAQFLAHPEAFQTEAFGNASLLVTAETADQLGEILGVLEGQLTGSIYSATTGADEELYQRLAPLLRSKVGRLLNDRMPTGVTVSPAMNHGGPYPATGHPGFTAVGIPASLRRFAMLQCFDHVRPERLPAVLGDKNAQGTWRLIDGEWTRGDVRGGGR